MALLVQKFGGTSVADPERIREVADHVARCRRRGDSVVLVVSAMGKETDELLRLAGEVSDIRPGREMDMLITAGERKAVALVSMALAAVGVDSESYTGSQAGFLTDTNHTNAKIVEVRADRIRAAVEAGRVPVVAGSQGVSTDNDVTFLGRGGSDTTAVALASALDADACELYTDVSGVFTTDPRVVDTARKMHRISFDEMLEMTAAGCPKPAMRSVEYAHRQRVPLHVRSAFTWEVGTWVTEEDPEMEQAVIRAVVADLSEAKVTVGGVPDRPGIAYQILGPVGEANIDVDMIVQNVGRQGVANLTFTVPQSESSKTVKALGPVLKEIGGDVAVDENVAKLSVVGVGMRTHSGVAAKLFEALAGAGINLELISTSEIKISVVITRDRADEAARVAHAAFELDTV